MSVGVRLPHHLSSEIGTIPRTRRSKAYFDLNRYGHGYCWGFDGYGQAGDGTTSDELDVPTSIAGGQIWSSVVNGQGPYSAFTGDTNCGLSSGIVYCWGFNDDRQIGDGTTNNQDVPTQVTVLLAVSDGTTVSVTVDPSFAFTVANQSSACNGESNFVSGAATATTVALGHLAISSNASGGQALTIAGNSGGGFVVYVRGTQATQDLRGGGHNWADVSGTYASPASLGAGEQFGYTYKDSTSSSSMTNPASAKFAALTNATTSAVMGSGSSESGSGCVSYDAQTGSATPAGSYTATVVYTAVPAF